jgi:hypothetical protein
MIISNTFFQTENFPQIYPILIVALRCSELCGKRRKHRTIVLQLIHTGEELEQQHVTFVRQKFPVCWLVTQVSNLVTLYSLWECIGNTKTDRTQLKNDHCV